MDGFFLGLLVGFGAAVPIAILYADRRVRETTRRPVRPIQSERSSTNEVSAMLERMTSDVQRSTESMRQAQAQMTEALRASVEETLRTTRVVVPVESPRVRVAPEESKISSISKWKRLKEDDT